VNVRVELAFYRALEAVARQDRRSVPQIARHLMEDGLRQRTAGPAPVDDTSAHEIARLASGGGGFEWLADEPELYGPGSGEPA
jgi:hypothetical protein